MAISARHRLVRARERIQDGMRLEPDDRWSKLVKVMAVRAVAVMLLKLTLVDVAMAALASILRTEVARLHPIAVAFREGEVSRVALFAPHLGVCPQEAKARELMLLRQDDLICVDPMRRLGEVATFAARYARRVVRRLMALRARDTPHLIEGRREGPRGSCGG